MVRGIKGVAGSPGTGTGCLGPALPEPPSGLSPPPAVTRVEEQREGCSAGPGPEPTRPPPLDSSVNGASDLLRRLQPDQTPCDSKIKYVQLYVLGEGGESEVFAVKGRF